MYSRDDKPKDTEFGALELEGGTLERHVTAASA